MEEGLYAGLATGVGSALAFFAKRTDPRFLSGALKLSMVTVNSS